MNWHWLLCGALLAEDVDNPDELLDQGVELDQSAALDDSAIDQSVDLGAPGQCVPDGGSAQFPGLCVAGGWCFELPLPQGYPLTAVWAGSPCDVWASGKPSCSTSTARIGPPRRSRPGPLRLFGVRAARTSGPSALRASTTGMARAGKPQRHRPPPPSSSMVRARTTSGCTGKRFASLGRRHVAIDSTFVQWGIVNLELRRRRHLGYRRLDVAPLGRDELARHNRFVFGVPGLSDGLVAFASNDVWAADALLRTTTSEICDYQFELRHYDGSTWTILQSARRLGILWGTGSNDIWTGSGMHWNGMQLEQVLSDWRPNARALAGTSPMDIWAVNGTAAPLHWNGSASTPGSSPNVRRIHLRALGRPDGRCVGDHEPGRRRRTRRDAFCDRRRQWSHLGHQLEGPVVG